MSRLWAIRCNSYYLLLTSYYYFLCIFILFGSFGVECSETNGRLPFCGGNFNNVRYLFVTTLDGKLTALNSNNNGEILWSIHPGLEPMLSSSIHSKDVTHYGEFVRMIPSLNGGLYMFDGEKVEPIPWTAEKLLKTSFRYADDLVMTGGKHSQTFGVSLVTGKLLYECSMKGCSEETKADIERHEAAGDILLVQKTSQVVRAVEARSGSERWNFSVAQHDLRLMADCHDDKRSLNQLSIKTVVPEGLICAVDKSNPSKILWKHKFDSPIVSAWEISKGKIFDIDLFDSFNLVEEGTNPSLYVGMHEKQLYIQESSLMIRKRQELALTYGQNLLTHKRQVSLIPWKPVAADSKMANLLDETKMTENANNDIPTLEVISSSRAVANLDSILNNAGFFLFTAEDLEKQKNALCNATIAGPLEIEGRNDSEGLNEETPVTVIVVSLWYWWREVCVISITTAIVCNWLFSRRFFVRTQRKPKSLEEPEAVQKQNITASPSSLSTINIQQSEDSGKTIVQQAEYVSRYLTDFEPIQCLGKGGFGVVFHARNKIDACQYAVKRIVLPEAATSRERVLREVRALAQLDHHHIVRYFNCWLESPPPHWQSVYDQMWCKGDTNSVPTSYQDSESTLSYVKPQLKCDKIMTETSGDKANTLPEDEDEDDSFIVFADEGHEANMLPTDHSVVIDSSRSSATRETNVSTDDCEKKKKKRRRDSSLCQSSSKLYLYIQMQLCQRESLKDWLSQNTSREYSVVLRMFKQIVDAVEYVHQNGLIHRDLKPSNIFFSMDNQIKIGDFGLVTFHSDHEVDNHVIENAKSERHTAKVGTQLYMSPEQLSGKPYNSKVDIFALGLILYELLVPFSTEMERQQVLNNIKQRKFPNNFQYNHKDEHSLLNLMLSDNPDERPTSCSLKSRPPLLTQTAKDIEC